MIDTPIFPNSDRVQILWTGVIDRIEGDTAFGAAKGTMESFDAPVIPDYGIGTRVEFYSMQWTDEPDATHAMVMLRPGFALVLQITQTTEGFEIISANEYQRAN